jgi:predicted Zn finger-like uncharacterized protein
MPSTQITCPECNASLKTSQPIPDGKRVKCPKCGAVFAAPGAVVIGGARADTRPARAGADHAAAGARKKGPARPPAPGPASKPDDDEDEGGTYRVIKPADEEEEEKPDITYVPDTSIKDLRGPAQAAIIGPSNHLILIAALGCAMNVIAFVAWLWPFIFSEYLIDHADYLDKYYRQKIANTSDSNERGALQARIRQFQGATPERSSLSEEDRAELGKAERAEAQRRILWMAACVLGLVYCATMTVGAIKMQHLESYAWGMTACIMSIVPIASVGGFMMVGWLLISQLSKMVLDAIVPDVGDMLQYAWLGAMGLWNVGIGIWALTVMRQPDVVAGFEYRPD